MLHSAYRTQLNASTYLCRAITHDVVGNGTRVSNFNQLHNETRM